MLGKLAGMFGDDATVELRQARRAYLAAKDARQLKISSFRLAARREISFVYPDSVVLMDNLSADFLAYSRSKNAFIIGHFEKSYPWLDHVEQTDSADAINVVLRAYANAVSEYERVIRGHDFSMAVSGFSDKRTFGTKGYGFVQIDSRRVAGGRLYKNDKLVASCSPRDGKPTGEIARALYEHVMLSCSGSPSGISEIRIEIEYENPGQEFTATFSALYNDNFRASADHDIRRLEEFCRPIKEFVSALEHEFRYSLTDDPDLDWDDILAVSRNQ